MAEAASEPLIWVVDDQQWPRAYLRAELIEHGCAVVGFTTIAEAVIALQLPELSKPRMIVLELRDQVIRREHLAALEKSGVPGVVLGGVLELSEPSIRAFNWTVVIKRPFTIGAVAATVLEWLQRHPLVPPNHPGEHRQLSS